MTAAQEQFATEVLWGIEHAKLLSPEDKLRFLTALKQGRFEEVRDELADAMETEVRRIDGDIAALHAEALSFIQNQMEEIDQYRRRRKPYLQRLFAWLFG